MNIIEVIQKGQNLLNTSRTFLCSEFFAHFVIKSVRCVGAKKITNSTANWNHCKFRLCVTLSFFASEILWNDKLIMLREIWFINYKVVGSWPINRSFHRFITFESCYCLGAAVWRRLTFRVSVIALKRLLQTSKSLFFSKKLLVEHILHP